jgi:Cft2 family RNA processing exonuclease
VIAADIFNEKVKAFMEMRPDPFGFDDVIYINSKEESQKLNDIKDPCIIISASGMADAGRIKHHIMHNITNTKNTILIVGYAEPNSLAGRLRNGSEEVRIFGDMYPVKAEIKIIDAATLISDALGVTVDCWKTLPGNVGSVARRCPDVSKLKALCPDFSPRSFKETIRLIKDKL